MLQISCKMRHEGIRIRQNPNACVTITGTPDVVLLKYLSVAIMQLFGFCLVTL